MVTGKAFYPKLFPDNRDMEGFEGKFVDCNGAYTIQVLLDDDQYQKLQESGSKLEGRVDDETGKRMVQFTRKHEIRNKDNEIVEAWSGPPVVKDAEGNEWVHSEEEPNLIGNGSLVNVAFTATQSKQKKSIVFTRLEAVQVLELQPYDAEGKAELPF